MSKEVRSVKIKTIDKSVLAVGHRRVCKSAGTVFYGKVKDPAASIRGIKLASSDASIGVLDSRDRSTFHFGRC